MSDRDPIYDAMKAHFADKFNADRARFLTQANADDDGKVTRGLKSMYELIRSEVQS